MTERYSSQWTDGSASSCQPPQPYTLVFSARDSYQHLIFEQAIPRLDSHTAWQDVSTSLATFSTMTASDSILPLPRMLQQSIISRDDQPLVLHHHHLAITSIHSPTQEIRRRRGGTCLPTTSRAILLLEEDQVHRCNTIQFLSLSLSFTHMYVVYYVK